MNLLKAEYQSFYDHGQMMELTIILLTENVDDQLDDETRVMADFDYF